MVNTRAALEKLWKGTCTVTVRIEQLNPVTKRTEFIEQPLVENQPCKLSIETITTTNPTDNAAQLTQKVKLFLIPEINIPAGSKITITQNGKTADYEKSGEPGVFTNHQEIILDLFKGWS